MIYWFTGQPGAGKTTLAKAMIKECNDNCIHIDGDGLRDLFQNFDYSPEGRTKNIQSVLDLCRFLDNKGLTVVVSVVAPYKKMRDSLKKTNNVTEIYVHTTEIRGREDYFAKDYEPPTEDFIDMDTTNISVKECLNKIDFTRNNKKYSMFIGRWQPWHDGHQWLIDQRIKEGKNICIAIRDIEPNENQPWTPKEVEENLNKRFTKEIEDGSIKVVIIPDIESINYGRGVGYEIIEHVPPNQVEQISATKIRAQMRKEGKL